MLKVYKIQSRRYIGSKTKIIDEIMKSIPRGVEEVADLFSGTGVVASNLLRKGYKVIVNDLLYSNFVAYKAFFGNMEVEKNKLVEIIESFNNSKNIEENYISLNFGGRYFSEMVARKIGFIRDEIDRLEKDGKINEEEKFILITSLMYSMDRYANTVGHYEMFLKREIKEKDFVMGVVDLSQRNSDIKIYNKDANELAKEIKSDVVYLDPPYNARQYINFYHVWENIALNQKPELKWESKKFDRTGLKSKYSQSSASSEMLDLSRSIKDVQTIIVSYNNTYKANSIASNNKISEDEMKKIFSNDRELDIKELDHSYFNAGKTNFINHKEFLYISKLA